MSSSSASSNVETSIFHVWFQIFGVAEPEAERYVLDFTIRGLGSKRDIVFYLSHITHDEIAMVNDPSVRFRLTDKVKGDKCLIYSAAIPGQMLVYFEKGPKSIATVIDNASYNVRHLTEEMGFASDYPTVADSQSVVNNAKWIVVACVRKGYLEVAPSDEVEAVAQKMDGLAIDKAQ